MSHLYRVTTSRSRKDPTVQYGSKDTFSSLTHEVTSEKALTSKQLEKMQLNLEELTRSAIDREPTFSEGSQTVTLPSSHRFTDINGKPCPHVTNIITPDKPTFIKHLEEHGLQGTWLDGCFKNLISEGILAPISETPQTPNLGSVKVLFEAAKDWVAKYVKKDEVEFITHSAKVFNEEHWFCGEMDAMGLYKGQLAIFDFKKTKKLSKQLLEKYFMQMAAYTLSDSIDAKPVVMVICSPYNPPIVSDDIEGYRKKFLELRAVYKANVGI